VESSTLREVFSSKEKETEEHKPRPSVLSKKAP